MSQGWQDDQDGEGFALFDVGTAKINNLISGGVVRAQAATGLLQIGLVSYADIQLVSASRLLGNPTGSAATVSEIPLNAPLFFSGGNLILNIDGTSLVLSGGTTLVRAALAGDVVATIGSNATTIQPHVVSYGKMQQASAHTLLGNPTGGTADVQEITIGTNLSFTGSVLNATGGGGSGITQLTGDVAAGPGTGSVAATVVNLPTGVTQAGLLNITAIAAPASPAAGHVDFYVDSTSLNFAAKNASGVINHGIQSNIGASHKFLSAIADDGSVTLTQPAFTDISGQATLAQLPSIGANTLLGNPTSGSATPTTIALGTTSGVLQYVNGSPDTLAVYAAGANRIPFGSGTSGQLTDTANFAFSGGKLSVGQATFDGALHVVLADDTTPTTVAAWDSRHAVFGQSSSTGAGTGFSFGNAANTAYVSFLVPGVAWSHARFDGFDFAFYASGATLGLHQDSAGNVYDGVLTTNGLLKTTGGTGLHAIASAADVAAAIVWPAATDVLVSAGTAVAPVGDTSFTFDTSLHVLAGGNAIGVNGVTLPTNASLVVGHTTNANRDRVQFFLGGGVLGGGGTSDSTLFDVSPTGTTVVAGVTAGIYATQRIRSLTYTGASAPTITEAASLYVDGAPTLTSLTGTAYALHVAGGNVRVNSLAGPGLVKADANGVLGLQAGSPSYTQQWATVRSSSFGTLSILSNKQTVLAVANGLDQGFAVTAAGGTAIATTIAANYTNFPMYFTSFGAGYAHADLEVNIINLVGSGSGSGTIVIELFSMSIDPTVAGDYTSLGSVSQGFSAGGSTVFVGLSTSLSAIPAGASLVLAVYRSDSTSTLLVNNGIAFSATLIARNP